MNMDANKKMETNDLVNRVFGRLFNDFISEIEKDVREELETEFKQEKECFVSQIAEKSNEIDRLSKELDSLVIKQNELQNKLYQYQEIQDDNKHSYEQLVSDLFITIDKNKNGKLEPDEVITQLIKCIKPEIIKEIDKNEDGVIQIDEMLDYIFKVELKGQGNRKQDAELDSIQMNSTEQ